MGFVEVGSGRIFDVSVGERPRAVIELHAFRELYDLVLAVKVVSAAREVVHWNLRPATEVYGRITSFFPFPL